MSTDLVPESSKQAAQEVPEPQVLFQLDAEAFATFERALAQPPKPSARLRRLLKTPAPWEKR